MLSIPTHSVSSVEQIQKNHGPCFGTFTFLDNRGMQGDWEVQLRMTALGQNEIQQITESLDLKCGGSFSVCNFNIVFISILSNDIFYYNYLYICFLLQIYLKNSNF